MFDGLGSTQIKPKLAEVIRVVAQAHGITVDEIKGRCRKRHLAWARQSAAYLCRELTDCSYPEIGRALGNQDHTTALFSYRKVSALAASDEKLRGMLALCREEIAKDAARRWEVEKELRASVAPPPAPPVEEPPVVETESRYWTHADIMELKRLRAQGLTRPQISWRMQRSVCAIGHKLKELKLTRPYKAEPKDITAWMEQAA